jgi:glycosyltransferase involved in cell wall biosynthesis
MSKPRVALHIIMPNQVSGPNTSNRLIAESHLGERFDFTFIVQRSLAGGRINLGLIRDLRAQFLQARPDLIHLSGLQASGFHAVVAARLAGYSNILVTIRGFSGDVVVLNPLKHFAFTHIIEPLTIRLSRNVLTVCEEAGRKPMVVRQRDRYLGVIHNPAPAIDFDVAQARDEFRRGIGARDDDFLVVVVGRMVYDKGIPFISDAIAQLDDHLVKCVFIGDGEYLEVLAQSHAGMIEDGRLFLLGKREDVKQILAGCDLFLFATLHENLSNALLEAMAVGLPVVATAVGGNVEVVEDSGNGYLVPPYDSAALADGIRRIWGDKALRRRMSARSQEIARDKFSQARIYGQLEAVYSMMLESGDK